MNILTYIEKLYQKWDGTDEQASLILRQINLALHISKIDSDETEQKPNNFGTCDVMVCTR